MIRDVKEHLQPVVLTLQLLRRPPQARKIQRAVERQRNITRHLGHESDFAWRERIDLLATESDCPQFAVRCRQWERANRANAEPFQDRLQPAIAWLHWVRRPQERFLPLVNPLRQALLGR